MDEFNNIDPSVLADDQIVTCNCCFIPVRRRVTKQVVRQIGRGTFEQIWCLSCISVVDADTDKLSGPDNEDTLDLGIDL